MVCIFCGSDTRVANSRAQKRLNGIWRRRQCLSCDAIFTTAEQVDLSKSVVVTYPSGAFLSFQRDRLFLDVYGAVKHRKTAQTDATALTDTVLVHVLPYIHQGALNRNDLQKVTHKTLAAFDPAAGVQYQAFHP